MYLVVTLNVLASRSWDSHTHYQQFREPPDDYGWGGPGHILRPLQAAVRNHLSRHDILLLGVPNLSKPIFVNCPKTSQEQ